MKEVIEFKISNCRSGLYELFIESRKKRAIRPAQSSYQSGYQSGYQFPSHSYSGSFPVANSPLRTFIDSDINIYFYEFSNPRAVPKLFTSVGRFEEFCRTHNISFSQIDRDLVLGCGTSRVACKSGCSSLIVRAYWIDLKDALESGSDF